MKVYDPITTNYVDCLQSCSDQTNLIQSTASDFPAKPTFPASQEFCVLLLKFVDQCKDEDKASSLGDQYPAICGSVDKLRTPLKEAIQK